MTAHIHTHSPKIVKLVGDEATAGDGWYVGSEGPFATRALAREASLSAKAIILKLRAEGVGYPSIARVLNERGIAPKRGAKWHASVVRYIVLHSA